MNSCLVKQTLSRQAHQLLEVIAFRHAETTADFDDENEMLHFTLHE